MGATSLDLWSQFHQDYCASATVVCVRVLSSVPIGRNSGRWGPATVQAMGYPIHEKALHVSLTRYIPHRSLVTEQVLKWHNTVSFSARRFCPIPPIVGQKCVQKCASQLRATLYNCMMNVTLNESEFIHKVECTACLSFGQLSVLSHATDDIWTQHLLCL